MANGIMAFLDQLAKQLLPIDLSINIKVFRTKKGELAILIKPTEEKKHEG